MIFFSKEQFLNQLFYEQSNLRADGTTEKIAMKLCFPAFLSERRDHPQDGDRERLHGE